ncbi:MAG: hypothetical protein IT580_02810, partial [Verrucomicrobiales bacterium]|nr:hypothetical protein [Verrucomicrobiales bacterium]
MGTALHLVTLREAHEAAGRLLAALPQLPELILGIPRSGMIFAQALAAAANVACQSVDEFLSGGPTAAGMRGRGRGLGAGREAGAPRRVLVLDDSVGTGRAMKEAREALAPRSQGCQFRFAAVIAAPEGRRWVEHHGLVVPFPRVFEWNTLHHHLGRDFCWDLDGVLCDNPPPFEEDGDCAEYEEFIRTAPPRFLPPHPLGWIVTSRLSRYRAPTLEWLAKHGIQHRGLVTLDLPSAAVRRRLRLHAQYKASVYASSPALLFVESDRQQARAIRAWSGKPVYCSDTLSFATATRWSVPRRIHGRFAGRAWRFALRKLIALRCAAE